MVESHVHDRVKIAHFYPMSDLKVRRLKHHALDRKYRFPGKKAKNIGLSKMPLTKTEGKPIYSLWSLIAKAQILPVQ